MDACNVSAMKALRKICGVPFPWAVALALVLAYLWIFGRATYLVWLVKKEAIENPGLAMVPVPLSDTSISTAQGTTLTEFGYQFDVPWKMIELKRGNKIAVFESESGPEAFMFWDPAEQKGFVKLMKDSAGAQLGALASVYGAQTIQSDYDFDQAVVNTTPSQLSYVLPRRKEVRAAALLMLKPIEMIDAETGFYSFETQRLRGFQNGNPSKTKNVMVKAFDAEGHQFEFVFGNRAYPNSGPTQADINMVLQTLRPAPAAQPEGPANSAGK
jgi:hypothetical protein